MQKDELFLKLLRVSELAKPKRIKKKKRERKENGQDKPKDKASHVGLSEKIVLKILLDEKKINQRTIAKRMNITAQAVSEIIKKMIELGYVYKESGVLHNENYILLTEKGENHAQGLKVEFLQDAENFLASISLTQEELLMLDILLTKLFESYSDID